MKEKRSLEFPASLLLGSAFDDVGNVDRHEVDNLGGRVLGKGREERLDVGFVALGSDDHDFIGTVVVPTGEEFIDRTVEGLASQGAGTRIRCPIRLRESVMEGRSHRQLQANGEIEGNPLGDQRIGAKGQVGSVMVERANGENQACVPGQQVPHLGPRKVAQSQ